MFELTENDIPQDSNLGEGQSSDVISSNNEITTKPEPQYFEYQASGKTIKEDLDTILKRASQGYNYAQHIQEHKNSVEVFNKERDDYLQKYGVWKQYDEYANQNPDWANFVKEQWEQRSTFGQPQAQPGSNQYGEIHPEIKAFMDEYRTNQRLIQEQQEDAALHEEIQAVQKQFPEFDLSFSNPETGKTIEMEVIEHAKAYGINSFKAAFKDLMFDKIVDKKITLAKEQSMKEIAARTKQGFISKSDTSLESLGMPKFKSSGSLQDELAQYAVELGIPL